MRNFIGDASTARNLQPWGSLSWIDDPMTSTLPMELPIKQSGTSEEFENEEAETLSTWLQLHVLLSDSLKCEHKSSIAPSPWRSFRRFNGVKAWLESSTLPYEAPEELRQRIERLFVSARGEVFEDGMESDFSRNLVALIQRYQGLALQTLNELTVNEQSNPEIVSEALRWIGHIENLGTQRIRRELLERSLFSPSPRIRDGAVLGLASLDDPKSIPSLETALERESLPELRDDMAQVIEQLQETLLEG